MPYRSDSPDAAILAETVVDFTDLLCSGSFKVQLGPEKREMAVPCGIAKRVSRLLHQIINNKRFQESLEGVLVLEETSPEVFSAFVQYALTSDYVLQEEHVAVKDDVRTSETVSQPHGSPSETDSRDAPPQAEHEKLSEPTRASGDETEQHDARNDTNDEILVTHYNPISKKRKRTFQHLPPLETVINGRPPNNPLGPEAMWHRFQQYVPAILEEACKAKIKNRKMRNTRDHHVITTANTLVLHASIFHFAHKYLIGPLLHLALRRLHTELLDLSLDAKGCARLFELLRHLYADKDVREYSSRNNEVREMVVMFCSAKLLVLAKYEAFKRLMDENGELGADILYRKIVNPEGDELRLTPVSD